MIRAIIYDISEIIQKTQQDHPFEELSLFLDANVKFYLNRAFLDDRIDDYVIRISQGPSLIHLKVQIREDQTDSWEHLGWSIDPPHGITKNKKDAYDRAMRGI